MSPEKRDNTESKTNLGALRYSYYHTPFFFNIDRVRMKWKDNPTHKAGKAYSSILLGSCLLPVVKPLTTTLLPVLIMIISSVHLLTEPLLKETDISGCHIISIRYLKLTFLNNQGTNGIDWLPEIDFSL